MATRAYVVFPSKNFADVAAYFQKLYGPPTGQAERYRSLLRTGRKPNIVLTWETVRTGADPATVLEVRKFDDVRSRRADTSIGIVRLFEKGSEPIFDAVSDRVFLVRRTSSDYQRSPEPDVR